MYLTHHILVPACLLRYTNTESSYIKKHQSCIWEHEQVNIRKHSNKYAVDCRRNYQLYDEMKRASQEVVDSVYGILLKHKRQSLSKKIPQSLFHEYPGVLESGKLLSK